MNPLTSFRPLTSNIDHSALTREQHNHMPTHTKPTCTYIHAICIIYIINIPEGHTIDGEGIFIDPCCGHPNSQYILLGGKIVLGTYAIEVIKVTMAT